MVMETFSMSRCGRLLVFECQTQWKKYLRMFLWMLGALVAKKWNFPEAIVEVIRCHHDTASAKDEHKKLTCLIHFADLLAHYSEGIIDWSNFESDELKLFSITDEVQVKELSEKMATQFKNSER